MFRYSVSWLTVSWISLARRLIGLLLVAARREENFAFLQKVRWSMMGKSSPTTHCRTVLFSACGTFYHSSQPYHECLIVFLLALTEEFSLPLDWYERDERSDPIDQPVSISWYMFVIWDSEGWGWRVRAQDRFCTETAAGAKFLLGWGWQKFSHLLTQGGLVSL